MSWVGASRIKKETVTVYSKTNTVDSDGFVSNTLNKIKDVSCILYEYNKRAFDNNGKLENKAILEIYSDDITILGTVNKDDIVRYNNNDYKVISIIKEGELITISATRASNV